MIPVRVVGAGLSGLAAALKLARARVPVTLIERRSFPGGRAYSFEGPGGEELDNGQHVFLHCCTAYRTFLRDIGAEDLVTIQPRTCVPFIDGRTGRVCRLRANPLLPAPLHFLPSLLRFGHLSWRERTGLVRCGRQMQRTDRQGLHDVSLGKWLRDHGQTTHAIEAFWNIPILGVLNDHADRVSAAAALFFFQEGFFGGKQASRIGVARVGLGRIAARAVESVREAGGTVRFGERAETLAGEGLTISAIPARHLLELLTPEQRALPFFAAARDLPTAPIVNVHLRFDRPIGMEPIVAFFHSPLQWVFDRTRLHGGDGATSLSVSLSGAHSWMDEKNADIERRCVDDLRRLVPGAREARVLRCVIVREPEATFVAAPGTRTKRLPCRTPIPGLILAGEWTESEWPSTMEAAVRSGVRAAEEALAMQKPPSG